nr:glycosyltransferase family 2 protein [uncultured Carboxylicivirga sp.]
MVTPSLFIVIAVHNRKEQTAQCLKQLASQTITSFNVVLVDDGSDDGTNELVYFNALSIHLVTGDGSWWWTRSMNEGVMYSLKQGADLIFTLNNDVFFPTTLIEDLLQLHQKHPQAMIGCLNTFVGTREYNFFAGVKAIHWWKAKDIKYKKAFTEYSTEMTGLHPTKCLPGRGTLIPRKVFEAIGLYDHCNFPQYAADYDFALRAGKAGFNVFISWDIKIQSVLETTGQGRTFIKQSWAKFFKSFFNPYSATSWRMWTKYYGKHAGWQMVSGLPILFLRLWVSFIRKQNQQEAVR